MKWVKLIIKNKDMAITPISDYKFDGMIGGDIIKKFCITIDNAKKVIVLSSSPASNQIEKSISLPFTLTERNRFYISGNLFIDNFNEINKYLVNERFRDSKKIEKKELFLFDTGMNGELLVNIET